MCIIITAAVCLTEERVTIVSIIIIFVLSETIPSKTQMARQRKRLFFFFTKKKLVFFQLFRPFFLIFSVLRRGAPRSGAERREATRAPKARSVAEQREALRSAASDAQRRERCGAPPPQLN